MVSDNHVTLPPGIGSTPLFRLKNVEAICKGEILAKAEFLNIGGSIKDRIVWYILTTAERDGLIKSGSAIVENTSGNTGFAIAMFAAQRGYEAILTMPDKVSKEKQSLLSALGAQVYICPTNVPPDSELHYVSMAKQIHKNNPNSFMINQYDNPLNTYAHYTTTGPELLQQASDAIDFFVASGSTGGTISGIGKYLKEHNPKTRVILLDPKGSVFHSYFHTGFVNYKKISPYQVEGVGEDHLTGCMDFSVIDDVVQFTDHDAFSTCHLLARAEGLICGGSSGANVWGAVQISERYPGSRIATILPDSGLKYLSSIYLHDGTQNPILSKSCFDLSSIRGVVNNMP